jgi:hypothetical protein
MGPTSGLVSASRNREFPIFIAGAPVDDKRGGAGVYSLSKFASLTISFVKKHPGGAADIQ